MPIWGQAAAKQPDHSYGPISASGEINGNAAFGNANSATPIKMAGLAGNIVLRKDVPIGMPYNPALLQSLQQMPAVADPDGSLSSADVTSQRKLMGHRWYHRGPDDLY